MSNLEELFHAYDNKQDQMKERLRRFFEENENKKEVYETLHGIKTMIRRREHSLHMMEFQAEKLGVPLTSYHAPIQKQIDVLNLFLQIGKEVLEYDENT